MLSTEISGPALARSNPPPSSGSPFIKIEAAELPGSRVGQGPDGGSGAIVPAPAPWHRGGLPPRALRRVREFIEANLEESISLQMLADIVGLSMCHFARAFKQSAGVTPHDYLVRHRVQRAQELLAGTDLPLSEIAIAVGFADQSHCARRFHEHVGLTPSRYRWSMR
jgi:transcriptional regulator GlxA family with amidase domain